MSVGQISDGRGRRQYLRIKKTIANRSQSNPKKQIK